MVVTCYHMIQQKLLIYLIGGATLALISIIPNTAFIAFVILFLLTVLEFVAVLASPMAQQVKNPPAMQETQVTRLRSLGREYPPEGEKAAHSGILAQKTPWTEDPGGPHSERSQRVKRDWAHTAQHNYSSLCQPLLISFCLHNDVTHRTYAFQVINPSPQPFTRALLAPLELSGLVIRFCLDSTFFLYLDLLTNILAMY